MKTYVSWQQLLLLAGITAFISVPNYLADAAFSQSDEAQYLNNFGAIQAATYSVADRGLPIEMDVCKSNASPPTRTVTVQTSSGVVNSETVSNQCGNDSTCIIPLGTTLHVDTGLNLGALVVKGIVEWNDATQVNPSAFVCAGYVAIEEFGKWDMDMDFQDKDAYIYIKDNGAVHPHLRSRAFGSYAATGSDYPTIDITGRELARTWSLLSTPIQAGKSKIELMHNAHLMGWRVGDRIGVSPTETKATGFGEEFTIVSIDDKGSLQLDKAAQYNHAATFVPPPPKGNVPALMSAEVVNLSRNIVITGDDFKQVPCQSNLPESVPGEQTSVLGCRCSSFRTQCTMGLHTAAMHGGSVRIQNTRIERAGQRGVEGKYPLHFHKLGDCPTCLFKNNAIENSHQRGLIIHSTHSARVEGNVLYNVRGAGIYIEDGNEMYNLINYNTVVCPFPFNHDNLHGCTVPGTSNLIADTSDNQSGIFSLAATNSLTGNRASNNFNGMFLKGGGIGRGDSYDKVCASAAKLARYEGNTFSGNGRFGTYYLGFNYPKATDQSIKTNGHNLDKGLCGGFDSLGNDSGVSASIVDNIDYNNAFVGQYMAGDIQYNGHHSYGSDNLLYWKETKPFQNECSAHVTGSSYARGNIALPDQATFLIEATVFGNGVSLEANHHCNVGTTGVLCFPTYMFHQVQWKNTDTSRKWIWFQYEELQPHLNNQNQGGVFTLSPPDAQVVMSGGNLEHSIFPPGFVSLVHSTYSYLLNLPGQPCVSSSLEFGQLYDGGILCRVPLRSLKVYSRGQVPGSAPNLRVQIWYSEGGVGNQDNSAPDSEMIIGYHQTGSRGPKQGYSFPVIPSANHSYRLSLTSGNGDVPSDWIVEFSDLIVGNRWSIEYINLSMNGRSCGQNGLVSSHHERRFIWSGDQLLANEAWGDTGACPISQIPDLPVVDCSTIDNGVLPADECPGLCSSSCDDRMYCDCGSAACQFKPGFTPSSSLCDAARCGEHGNCSAKYLGGELPVTANACICDEGWSGPLCQFNPCEDLGKTCSGRGTCVASSDTDAKCVCDPGFSGDDCESSCNNHCPGDYPYGCATNIDDIQRYGCNGGGGCNYLREGESYPFGGFCTYKQGEAQECLCGSDNDCERSVSCNPDGSCTSAQYLPDFTACNSVPFGICKSGTCVSGGTSTSLPTTKPTPAPSPSNPVSYCGCDSCSQQVWDLMMTDTSGTYSCGGRISWLQTQGYSEDQACSQVTSEFPNECLCDTAACATTTPPPTPTPTPLPSKIPTSPPVVTYYCGCTTCTQGVWDRNATDGGGNYSCGGRISWLQNADGYSEAGACQKVSNEFPDICLCGTNNCVEPPSPSTPSNSPSRPPSSKPIVFPTNYPSRRPTTLLPTTSPSSRPSEPPSTQPTMTPTNKLASSEPSLKPTQSQVSSFCGCSDCTESVWNTAVTDDAGTFTCGQRISYLQTAEGGSLTESNACSQVSQEFPTDQCGPICNPSLCNAQLDDPDPSKLIWSDEFNVDGAPDPSRWTYDLGDGCNIGLCNWGNGEVAYYTNSPSNVMVSNGVLSISAKKESGFSLPYTSTRMVTRGLQTFKYGRVQFRANLARCKAVGTWPALWMLPEDKVYGGWPNSGEIDVMEAVGHEADRFYGTVHTSSFNGMDGTQKGNSIYKSKNDWHVFEINWEVDRIQFAVDKQIYFEYQRGDPLDWPFNEDFHLILNVAVGGSWGGAAGIDAAAFDGEGQIMEVDWVRVYADEKQPTPQPASYCGCDSCSQQVWDLMMTDTSGTYSCGGRISWLQTQGYSEDQACSQVTSEFPNECLCDTAACATTTPPPTPTPTPTPAPSKTPTSPPVLTYCGCTTCTQGVWDRIATDGGGSYSCGARISWLQNADGYSEAGACQKVSNEFPTVCLCNPSSCSVSNMFN